MQTYLLLFQQLIIIVLLLCLIWTSYGRRLKKWWKARRKQAKRRRQLRPRSPRDCVQCCLEHLRGPRMTRSPPPRWQDFKSPRGRPKEYDSEGFACLDASCIYYKVTDQQIHALRRDGTRNECEAAAQWECGYCDSKHTAWLGTPQYRLKTPSQKVSLALHMHMKGVAAADISELLETSESTIQRWLDRGGQHSERLHARLFKNLSLQHIQLDELVTKVRKRAKRVWVWTGMDVQTKLLLAWVVGGRSQAEANQLVHQIEDRLQKDHVPAFTSDGLNQYFYALTAHWGFWTVVEGKRKPVWVVAPDLLYGQFRKIRAGYKLKYFYTRMLCGTRADMIQHLQGLGLSGIIQTAFVERLNLTLRHIVPALRRRTWALANNIQSLRLRFALGAAYYNFCRPHQALKGSRYRHRTPAMAAGITDHPWKVREFVLHPVY
jgi:IS1 family transposase/transposase-like protein